MSETIFSADAVKRRQRPRLGAIVIDHRPSAWFASFAAVAAAMGITVLAASMQIIERVELGGVILPKPDLRQDQAPGARSPLSALLFAESGQVAFIHTGQTVRLRIDAFPSKKFGTVRGLVVAITALRLDRDGRVVPHGIRACAALGLPGLYGVTVHLQEEAVTAPGAMHRLRAGMSVHAAVVVRSHSVLTSMIGAATARQGSGMVPMPDAAPETSAPGKTVAPLRRHPPNARPIKIFCTSDVPS